MKPARGNVFLRWVFWGSLGVMVYTYVLFPLVVLLRALIKKQTVVSKGLAGGCPQRELPSLSFIIAAYNEEPVIAAKLTNVLELDYPRDRIEVIVASDGSDDRTNEIVSQYPSRQVRLMALPRRGKNHTINQAVAQAKGDLLVFTDADSMWQPSALGFLVDPFADPQVGGVAGSYRYGSDPNKGSGERAYWSFDQKLRDLQSKGGDLISATGHIYAIRRELFKTVPGGVTDDAYISRSVIGQHKRLVFEPRAVAYGPIADEAGEFRRKVRVTSRGLNAVWKQLYLLNPFAYGFYAVQLFTHKVLRRLMFIPMGLTLIFSTLLWRQGILYRMATLGQFALHLAAFMGYLLREKPLGKSRLLSLPYFLDMTNLASILAVKSLLQGESRDVWVAERGSSQVIEEPHA